MSQKKKGKTVKNTIYRSLRSEILNGFRKPGERLAVDVLTNDYGTSVTPVRDALQMLNQEGLITIRPRSGYFVVRITLKELTDMLDLREILELAALERAATRITPEQLVELKRVHAGYTGEDSDSYTRYTDENRRFHYLIAEASGNRELATMLGHLHDRMGRFMVIRRAGEDLPDIHGILIEKLEKRDADGARQALSEEMKNTRLAIMERIMQEEAAFWHLGSGDSES